jgi:hypothetical protein
MRGEDRVGLVLDPRAMLDDLVASRQQAAPALCLSIGQPDLGQEAGGLQRREHTSIYLVGLDPSVGDRLHLQRVGDDHPRHVGAQHMYHSHRVAGGLDHHLVVWSSCGRSPQAPRGSSRPGHTSAAVRLARTPPPRRCGGCPCRSRASSDPPCLGQGSGGPHDNYGSALAAQPGGSQGRPATNASSRLIETHRPAHASCSQRPAARMVAPYAKTTSRVRKKWR